MFGWSIINIIVCYNYKLTAEREWVDKVINKGEYFIKQTLSGQYKCRNSGYSALCEDVRHVLLTIDRLYITMQMSRKYSFIVY